MTDLSTIQLVEAFIQQKYKSSKNTFKLQGTDVQQAYQQQTDQVVQLDTILLALNHLNSSHTINKRGDQYYINHHYLELPEETFEEKLERLLFSLNYALEYESNNAYKLQARSHSVPTGAGE